MPETQSRKLAIALVCADWRQHHRQTALISRLSGLMRMKALDLVALPGPDGLMKPERDAEREIVVGWIKLLVAAHHPKKLAVVAHERCAGHPVSDADHAHDVVETAKMVKSEIGMHLPVYAIVSQYRDELDWDLKLLERF